MGIQDGRVILERSLTIALKKKKTLSIQLPYDPVIVLLGIYPREMKNLCPHKNLFINVYSSFICNSHKLETTQMQFDGGKETSF